jgi:adenosylhomocysteine nucleosidase
MKSQLPPMYADTWAELFPLEIQNEAAGATPKLKEAIGAEILLLERSRHLVELLLLGLYFGAGETEAVLEVDYGDAPADDQVWQLSAEELSRQRVGIRKARQWIDTSLKARPYLTPGDIAVFRELHAGLPESPTEHWDWRGVAKYAEVQLAECSRQAMTALDVASAIAVHRGQSPSAISYRNILFVSFTAGRNRRYVEQRVASAIRDAVRRARKTPERFGRLVQIPADEDIRLWGADIVLTALGKFARASLVQAVQGIWAAAGGEAEFRFAFYVNMPDDEPLITGSDPGPFHGRLFRQRLADLRRIKLVRELREGVLVIQAMGSGVNPTEVKEIIRAAGGEPGGKIDRLSLQPVERRFRIVPGRLPAVERTFGAVRQEDRVNVGIITIVAHEAQAVRKVLEVSGGYEGEKEVNGRFFEYGSLPAQTGVHRIVTTTASNQGAGAVMSAYDAMMREFAPHMVALVGIGGGIHSDLNICDVAVADQIFYYDRRKITPTGVLRRMEGYRPEGRMKRLLIRYQSFRGDPASLESLHGKRFRVFVGPIATGEAVIADPNAEEKVYTQMVSDKCLAVEMEAAGLAQAVADDTRASTLQASGYLVIRGISDLADTAKSDTHRIDASTNAMVFLRDFLSIIPPFRSLDPDTSPKR